MKFTVNESAQNRRIVYWYEDNFLETEECFKFKTGSLEKILQVHIFMCLREVEFEKCYKVYYQLQIPPENIYWIRYMKTCRFTFDL